MSKEICIKLTQVNHYYGEHRALTDINLEIPYGGIYGLLGPSGGGKTTIVKLISGILDATSGETLVLGEKMPKLALMRQIGYMAQSDALYLDLTATENIAFFGAVYGMNKQEIKQRTEDVLELVGLAEQKNKIVHNYSGGMKRRLSLAIAVLCRPRILLLDEPTVGIDPILRREIWNEFRALSQAGTTILVTTHVMDEAEKCNYLAMIREGKIIASGTTSDLMSQSGSTNLEEAFFYYGGISHES